MTRSSRSAAVPPPRPAGTLFIEGVGGVMVPLDARHTVLDWMADLGLPILLVTGAYLGTISHTLTALAALAGRGLAPKALVVNDTGDGPVALAETAADHRPLRAVRTHRDDPTQRRRRRFRMRWRITVDVKDLRPRALCVHGHGESRRAVQPIRSIHRRPRVTTNGVLRLFEMPRLLLLLSADRADEGRRRAPGQAFPT